jgi:NAD(P)-dependent dehydrogenase (short-subunit alcohol dehydrogenase family)
MASKHAINRKVPSKHRQEGLDVTRPSDAEAAVKLAVDGFGGIDVLVNNARSFYGGYFEVLTQEQIQCQITTNL